MRKTKTVLVVAVASALFATTSCGPSEDASTRDRNAFGDAIYENPYDNYSVDQAVSRPANRGYSTPITDGKWDPTRYATGPTRAQMSTPRTGVLSPPPVPDRPSIGRFSNKAAPSRALTSSAGKSLSMGSLGKVLGGLGNGAAMMGASLAVAGIGMALSALGAPPFLTALFGGDDGTAAALAAIQQTLREIQTQLNEAIEKIDGVSAQISDLSTAVSELSKNQCSSFSSQRLDGFLTTFRATEEKWRSVWVNQNAALASSAVSGSEFTPAQRATLDRLHTSLQGIDAEVLIPSVAEFFVGSTAFDAVADTRSGFLSQIQQCTLANKRFLTNMDTAKWEALGIVVAQYAAHVADLAVWDEMYQLATSDYATEVAVDRINYINALLRQATSIIGFHTSMQIPDGQMLDTVTNKMWRIAPDASSTADPTKPPAQVALIDALKGCIPDTEVLTNYAPQPSWDGFATVDLPKCVASSDEANKATGFPLDLSPYSAKPTRRVPNAGQWRIPIGAELTRNESNFAAGAKDVTPGLLDAGVNNGGGSFDPWMKAKCGPTKSVVCAVPSDYLTTYGADATYSNLSVVWTNTALAEVGQAGKSLNCCDELKPWTTTGPVHGGAYAAFNYNGAFKLENGKMYGFCEDGDPMNYEYSTVEKKYQTYCNLDPGWAKILQISYKHPTPQLPRLWSASSEWWNIVNMDHFCFRVTNKITKSGHDRSEWNTPYYAEVGVLNFGDETSTTKAMITYDGKPLDVATPSSYMPIKPGKVAGYFANRSGASSAVVACAHGWYETTRVDLPETAQVIWVRDLLPDEIYYSIPGSSGPTPRGDMRAKQAELEPPAVSIMSLAGHGAITTLQARSSNSSDVVVKCMINAETVPVEPKEVAERGTDCPSRSFILNEGIYDVDAVAIRYTPRLVNGVRQSIPVISQIESARLFSFDPVKILAEKNKPASPVTTPPSTTSTTSTTAPTETKLDSQLVSAASNIVSPPTSAVPQAEASPIANQLSTEKLGAVDAATILRRVKAKLKSGDRINITVDRKSRRTCQYITPNLLPLRSGKCKIKVTIMTRRGSQTVKSTSFDVS